MLGYLVNPTTQFISKSGLPLTDGHLTVYIASSTTTAVTYSDFEGTLNQTSIELDSLGQAVVIADDSYAYDLYVYDSAGVLQYSRMNVTVNNATSSSVSEVNESLIEVSSSLREDIETKQDSFNLSGNLEWLNDSATLHSPYYSGSDYISIEDNVVSLNDPKTLVIDSPLSSYETTSKIHIGLDEDYVKEEELTGYVTLSDFKTYTGSHYGEWYSLSQSNSNLSKRMTSAETNTASLASDTASLDEAINTLEGYSYSYTPEVTEGTLLGTLTLKDADYNVYAPESTSTSDGDSTREVLIATSADFGQDYVSQESYDTYFPYTVDTGAYYITPSENVRGLKNTITLGFKPDMPVYFWNVYASTSGSTTGTSNPIEWIDLSGNWHFYTSQWLPIHSAYSGYYGDLNWMLDSNYNRAFIWPPYTIPGAQTIPIGTVSSSDEQEDLDAYWITLKGQS